MRETKAENPVAPNFGESVRVMEHEKEYQCVGPKSTTPKQIVMLSAFQFHHEGFWVSKNRLMVELQSEFEGESTNRYDALWSRD